ncbi:hypothetical protein ACFVR6_03725 [Microbacterium sp. NPDC058021]|uniref:hypothetical protein n=1 Tax=Microbacterium sp. NPDC058021 TaxID=3346306 RepID=UPI0036DB04F2
MKTIDVKNGPLHGTTQQVPDDATAFTHHADPNGYYKVNEKTATWQATTPKRAATVADDTTPTPAAVVTD